MGESFILFKYEPLTPNIDKAMKGFEFLERGLKIQKKSANIGLFDLGFCFFVSAQERGNLFKPFSQNYGSIHTGKGPVQIHSREPGE